MRACLAGVTASSGVPKAAGGPSLHLAHGQHAALDGDHVELTRAARAPVAVEHPPAPLGVPGGGEVLPTRPQCPTHEAPRGVRATRGNDQPIRLRRSAEPSCSSFLGSSSTLTSLKVTIFTLETKRVWRYMSHTHASPKLKLDPAATAVVVETRSLALVGQVELALRLHHVKNIGADVLVLLVELELDLHPRFARDPRRTSEARVARPPEEAPGAQAQPASP